MIQLLAAGVLLNSVAQIPFVLLQGAGRASWTAKLHALELPFYVALAWYLVRRMGVNGAAFAWTLRCSADTIAVLLLAGRIARLPKGVWWWIAGSAACCAAAAFASAYLTLLPRLGLAASGALALLAVSVRGLAVGEHVAALRGSVTRRARRA